MKKAIVTGANGFVGAAVCKELERNNIEVIAVVRNKNSDDSRIANLKNVRIIYCELKDIRNLATYVDDRDIDIFYHFAWDGSSGDTRSDIELQLSNVKYTCDSVKACADLCCKRFVYAGSIMEYEVAATMNDEKKLNINSIYCSAKQAADYMAKTIADSLGISYIRGIISNVYGPGEMNQRLVNTALRKILSGERCSFSAGEQLYDFIYITDAAKAFIAIGEKGISDKTYYIGTLKPRKLKEFLLEMRDAVNPNIEIGLGEIPFDGKSLLYNEFDVTAVKRDTGFIPEVSFSDGIKHTVAWLKQNIFLVKELETRGAFLIEGFHVKDNRGGFAKYFEKNIYLTNGIKFQLNETFVSISEKNVVRGLHFQLKKPQAKLVSVISGKAWDVVVDLRPDSQTYKHWTAVELSEDNYRSLYIPRGFAHGFLALSNNTMMLYQCDGIYDKTTDTGIIFNDSDIGIMWPIAEEDMIHSPRDMHLMTFAEYEKLTETLRIDNHNELQP